jgi:hypothetical protein
VEVVTIEADDHLFPKQRAVVIEHYEAELWTVRVVIVPRTSMTLRASLSFLISI